MLYSFFISGHPNITAFHRTTVEFTKETDLTRRGDCIVGVGATFDSEDLMSALREARRIRVEIEASGIKEHLLCEVNGRFCDPHEIVIRKTGFLSDRTLGIMADKAACDISRNLVNVLANPATKAKVSIYEDSA